MGRYFKAYNRFRRASISFRIADMEAMANSQRVARNATPVGTRLAHRFVARREESKTRWIHLYGYQRAQYEDRIIISDWFRFIASVIAKYNIEESDIYNFEGTGAYYRSNLG
jgi:hypothetical protein